jgi:hypothetical protein
MMWPQLPDHFAHDLGLGIHHLLTAPEAATLQQAGGFWLGQMEMLDCQGEFWEVCRHGFRLSWLAREPMIAGSEPAGNAGYAPAIRRRIGLTASPASRVLA